MLFIKKSMLIFAGLALILLGGTGTQSPSLLLQGGGFIGLIVGLVILYIFGKMAWRAMGCVPSFLIIGGVIFFILYAIGAFRGGVENIGGNLNSFAGRTTADKKQMKANIDLMGSGNLDSIGEGFSSGSNEGKETVEENDENGLEKLFSSFSNKKTKEPNPKDFPPIYGPARVINGNTLYMQGKYFRLYGIDAPDKTQTCADRLGRSYNCGSKAINWLRGWITDNVLECRVMQQDANGNMVGVCSLGHYDIGAALVNAGWAVAYVKYTSIYVPYEVQAKQNGRGLWQGQFYMPWDWRIMQAQKPKIKVIKAKEPKRKSILDL